MTSQTEQKKEEERPENLGSQLKSSMSALTSQALKSLKDVSRAFYHTIVENESDGASSSELYEVCSSDCSRCSKGLSSYMKNSSAKSSMQKYPMLMAENPQLFNEENIFAPETQKEDGEESEKSKSESDEHSGGEDENQENLLLKETNENEENSSSVGYLVDGDISCEVIDRVELAER